MRYDVQFFVEDKAKEFEVTKVVWQRHSERVVDHYAKCVADKNACTQF